MQSGVGVLLRLDDPEDEIGERDNAIDLVAVVALDRVEVRKVEQHQTPELTWLEPVAPCDLQPVEERIGAVSPHRRLGDGRRRPSTTDRRKLGARQRIEELRLPNACRACECHDRVLDPEAESCAGLGDDGVRAGHGLLVESALGQLAASRSRPASQHDLAHGSTGREVTLNEEQGRKRMAAGRRHRQPHRPHPVPGQGRPAARRPVRGAGAGDRVRTRRTPGAALQRADRPGRRRVRRGGQLRRPVGQGAGGRWSVSRCRCTRASTSTSSPRPSRASTRTCRSCATRTAGPTSRRRSAASSSAASSPRRSRGGRRRHPVPVRVPAPRRGLGPLLGPDGRGAARDPGARRDRDPEVLQRPGASRPDNQFLLGRGAGARGFFVGAGFNSVGIASAGGAGRALAEWVVAGEPTRDLAGVDLRRFAPWAADHARGCATGWWRSSGCTTPSRGPTASRRPARDVRRSPLHERLAGRGASSAPRTAGSGRTSSAGGAALDTRGTSRRGWPPRPPSSAPRRTAVAVFDQTSFSKYVVAGPGALAALQWVCAADVDVPVGHCRLHAVAQRARHLRGRPHRHPRRARLLLDGLAAPRPPCATSTGCDGHGRVRGRGRHRRASRSSG